MKVCFFLLLFIWLGKVTSLSQINPYICGSEYLTHAIIKKNAIIYSNKRLSDRHATLNSVSYTPINSGLRDSSEISTIPIVFHVILNQQQIDKLGGPVAIEARIDSQVAVINRDFNRQNGDSILIPAAFKSLYADAGIKFSLAHTAPNGGGTPGFEIINTSLDGFELSNGYGSGFGFSDAKYKSSGGLDCWAPESYLNIWVIKPRRTPIVGLTVPASYIDALTGIPAQESGIVLNYSVFGLQTDSSQYYLSGKNRGRTLTHELGHYFEIWHTWGDNNGSCNEDDGIEDTPPQAYATYGCAVFPKYDVCSSTGSGVLFMNYMDYSDDACKCMFTQQQANVMQSTLQFSGQYYSLTQHPQLLQWPNGSEQKNSFSVYPNPATTSTGIFFKEISQDLQSISLIDILGRTLQQSNTFGKQAGFYSFDLSNLSRNIYFIKLVFDNKTEIRKIVKQ